MLKLNISPDFTIEDIHKVREYNYEMTKNMTVQEKKNYYEIGAKAAKEKIEKMRSLITK